MSSPQLATGAAAVMCGASLVALAQCLRPAFRHRHPTRNHKMQHDCPTCTCCTAELCRRAAASLRGCRAHTAVEHQQTVSDCPCSAPTTTASFIQLDATEHVRPHVPYRSEPVRRFASVVFREAVMDELVMRPEATLVAIRQVTTTLIAVQPTADAGGESW